MVGYLISHGSDLDDAEDIVQDALETFLRFRGRIQKPGALFFRMVRLMAGHRRVASIRTRQRLADFVWAGCSMAGPRCHKCGDPAKRVGLCPTHAMQEYRKRAA
jgi:DNA-directed RNA polymerase specialized sigma24 family protein